MKRPLHLVGLLTLGLLLPLSAYCCVCCYFTTTFSGGGQNGKRIALIQVLHSVPAEDDYHQITYAKVVDDLYGNISRDTILLVSSGYDCSEYVFSAASDTLLVKLHGDSFNGEQAYGLEGCGRSVLRYKSDTLLGSIIPYVNKLPYRQYKENFAVYESSPSYFAIRGRVFSCTDRTTPVSGLAMDINGFAVEKTDALGSYHFPYVELYDDNKHRPIKPASAKDIQRGLSIIDIIKIRKHLLGKEELQHAWQVIAADVNNSQSVTTYDLVLLTKVIMQIENAFPGNQTWRFIKKNHVFPIPKNPWYEPFEAEIIFHALCTGQWIWDTYQVDLIAIKVGDVDGSFVKP